MNSYLLVFLVLFGLACANNITAYQSIVNNIVATAQQDTTGYSRLSHVCDTYGPRMTGMPGLQDALDWVVSQMETDGFDSVYTESVMVPNWEPNQYSLYMSYPRQSNMALLPLGGSIATPEGGISGEVLVVTSFEDLAEQASAAEGKIVVYNVPFTSYSATVKYRTEGAKEAAKVGAIASLTRSVTPYSLYTPHTGIQYYEDGVPQIPAAAITIEDATLLQRFQDSGITPILTLSMSSVNNPFVESQNVIAEIKGSVLPEELVVFGGHSDSWYVGTGAQDDMGGCLQAWEAARLLLSMGLRPRRTLRVVLWTSEENGGYGADQYYSDNLNQLNDTVYCMESDSGTFVPNGLSFTGTSSALNTLQEVANLLAPTLNITVSSGGAGADVTPLTNAGVPGAGLTTVGSSELYFNYHHTNADTVDHVDQDDFNLCVATMASVVYVIADMDETLPRT